MFCFDLCDSVDIMFSARSSLVVMVRNFLLVIVESEVRSPVPLNIRLVVGLMNVNCRSSNVFSLAWCSSLERNAGSGVALVA
ncbi:hypothetical protein TNCV_1908081 [Trichonephila clavipes]|nr:hypothetical protein TNCV_1908081 [Trichonephila clavipes]